MKRLIIMRGLPGSGKSTLARTFGGTILSTDDFWMQTGKYDFDPTKLSEAHTWNQRRTEECMVEYEPIIVIDNTNIRLAHIKPYLDLARQYDYQVEYVTSDTRWAFNPIECAIHCTHNVPVGSIQRMLNNWEEI